MCCAQRMFLSELIILHMTTKTAVTGNSHTTAVWPTEEHNRQIPMYSFIRFHETKLPVAVSYHKHHCSYMILFSFCFTNAKQNGGQLRCETYYMHDFHPGIECDEIQCIDVTSGLFRGMRHCRQPIKITMSVHPSVHTHEITIKAKKEFS
jgi:hypothetical protein